MDEIKSARQIAMEKLEGLGEVSNDERLKWKYTPEGKKLAARYIRGGKNLASELSQYDQNAQSYVREGVAQVLISNITLPNSDLAKRTNKRAMDGLRVLKNNQASIGNVYGKLNQLFSHYLGQGEQQRQQAYQSLKTKFESQLRQALQQQLGTLGELPLDVGKLPQFQAEWKHHQTQLDSQYLNLLNEYKGELSTIFQGH
ncbi:MAG: hypothetical protein J7K77_03525 [Dehalococcoidales bacterium]|nr:hypothetical protein [Dehalococcoidales bacterium]